VIGVMKKQGSLFGMSMDNRALAPARSPMGRLVNPQGIVDRVLVKPLATEDMAQAQIDIEAIMRVRHKLRGGEDSDFAIETAAESMSFWENIRKIMMIAFPGLVSIALVVGGIVIMNIMLVSVTERTREIGIRLAIGATASQVLLQFLVEAVVLSLFGGIIGILLGFSLSAVAARILSVPLVVVPQIVAIAFAFSAAVGVVFGYFPARRAARLDPIEALRHE
jgi:putative ABC transport system permease protein